MTVKRFHDDILAPQSILLKFSLKKHTIYREAYKENDSVLSC